MATTPDPQLRWLISLALTAGACAKERPGTIVQSPGTEAPAPAPSSPGTATATATATTGEPAAPPSPSGPDGESTLTAPGTLPEGEPSLVGESTCGRLGEGTRPVGAVDGLVLIEDNSGLHVNADLSQTRAGSPCKTASAPEACEQLLTKPPQQALRTECGQMGCTKWALGWTARDRVGWVTSPEELRSFLGPVDTPAEARLLAWQEGYGIGCDVTKVDGGYTLPATMMVSDCPMTNGTYVLKVTTDGTLTKLSEKLEETTACAGRLPPGLIALPTIPEELSESEAAADWLARIAHLEASAVHAFDTLAHELEVHGAPASLIAAAREAQADEVRHAERVGALALRLGGKLTPVEIEEVAVRSLEEIAIDNAEEGLVRETWGAVVGSWQAENAELPEVRTLMAEIAEDEVRHAELSRALHRWLEPKLDRASLDRVEEARVQAWQRMIAGVRPANTTSRALGLPTGAVAQAMLAVVAAA